MASRDHDARTWVPSSAASMASRIVLTRSRASSSDRLTMERLYHYDTEARDILHRLLPAGEAGGHRSEIPALCGAATPTADSTRAAMLCTMGGYMAATSEVQDDWLVFGVSLRFHTCEEGGRSKPLGVPDTEYVRYQYRPNWGLPEMTGTDQVGAPVLWLQHYPANLGETLRAVIVPLAPGSLHLWRRVEPGDSLRMFEGPRLCGQAVVEWVRSTVRPVPDEEADRFVAWAEGGEQPL